MRIVDGVGWFVGGCVNVAAGGDVVGCVNVVVVVGIDVVVVRASVCLLLLPLVVGLCCC